MNIVISTEGVTTAERMVNESGHIRTCSGRGTKEGSFFFYDTVGGAEVPGSSCRFRPAEEQGRKGSRRVGEREGERVKSM